MSCVQPRNSFQDKRVAMGRVSECMHAHVLAHVPVCESACLSIDQSGCVCARSHMYNDGYVFACMHTLVYLQAVLLPQNKVLSD